MFEQGARRVRHASGKTSALLAALHLDPWSPEQVSIASGGAGEGQNGGEEEMF